MTAAPLAWRALRSLLFVPVLEARFVAGAHRRGADAVILDLEDSIAGAAKLRAQAAVGAAVEAVAARGVPVLVRVNADDIPADLAAAVRTGLAGVVLPKVERADQVDRVCALVAAAEASHGIAAGTIALVPTAETPRGILHCEEIAAADPRVRALMFGPEDLSALMGIAPEPSVLGYPAQRVVLAANAAGIPALGLAGSVGDFTDLAAFGAIAAASRALGLSGAACIHPAQVAVLNAAFGPTEDEIAAAERICRAYLDGLARGLGAVGLDGRMIDAPIARRAAFVLARAGQPAGDDAPADWPRR
jgi:citrate lyase subunit beta/citryl-CoA lyase